MGKKVLITGGLGFVGSNLAIALANRGDEVTVIDALLPEYGAFLSNIAPVQDRITVVVEDVRNVPVIERLVSGQDVIYSLAGQVSHLRSMEDPATDLDVNCRTNLILVEACRRRNPEAALVLASTRQVYGRPKYLPVDEAHPTVPVDINGIHKLAAEEYYNLYRAMYGMRSVVLRLTNTYGPRMDLINSDKGVVAHFLRKALRGEPLYLFGSGAQQRDFNYIDDVVDALCIAADLGGGSAERVFNLGFPRAYSLLEFVRLLQSKTDCQFENVDFPREQLAIEIGDYHASIARIHEVTGWYPVVDLSEGLDRTLAYFRANPHHFAAIGGDLSEG